MRVALRALVGTATVPVVPPETQVAGLRLDSRRLAPGELFVALPGRRGHGLDHAEAAFARGAVGVLSDRPPDRALPGPVWVLPDLARRLWSLAEACYRPEWDRVRVVTVTGTNGKSSVVSMVAAVGRAEGIPVGELGTLAYRGPGHEEPAVETTPHFLEWLRLIARWQRAVSTGSWWVVGEASSHALAQGRLGRIPVAVAAATGLGRDHLDYHGSLAAYARAKARLFAQPTSGSGVAVVPVGEPRWWAAATAAGRALVTVGAAGGWRLAHVRVAPYSVAAELIRADLRLALTLRTPARYQLENAAVAVAVAEALGIAPERAVEALAAWPGVPGRMELVAERPRVVVDYAHTPDALARVLAELRPTTAGRLWVLFGAGGERDRGKRPAMGRVAERLADHVVLTSDNPRGEDPEAILAEIAAGMRRPEVAWRIPDRGEAIARTLEAAAADDTILIAGKGHEQWQEVAGERRPFDDREEVRRWLQ